MTHTHKEKSQKNFMYTKLQVQQHQAKEKQSNDFINSMNTIDYALSTWGKRFIHYSSILRV